MACACGAQVYSPAPPVTNPPAQVYSPTNPCNPAPPVCNPAPAVCPQPCPTGCGPAVRDYPAYFRAGAAWLISDVGDGNSRVEPIVGLGYEVPISGNPTTLVGLSVDWIPLHIEADTDDDGDIDVSDTINTFPVLVYFKKTGPYGEKYRPYFALGVGARWSTTDIEGTDFNSGAHFAWEAEAGTYIAERYMLSLRFIAGENPSDFGVAAVQLGYRF